MYVKVNVKTNQRAELIEKIKENHYKISVKEKPERNMANKRILELMSKEFGVSVSNIKIINGHQQPSKMLSLDI